MAMVTAMVMAMGIDGGRQPRADHRFSTIVPGLTAVARRKIHRRAWVLLASALVATSADAQSLRLGGSVNLRETYTSNVNLDPPGAAKSDFVTELSPTATVDYKGSHSSLKGVVTTPILLYARTGSENNQAYVSGDLTGMWEPIDRFFFIEAEATASQQFFTPFGATPVGLVNATNNRYTSVFYRVTPYIQGVTGGNITYLLRFNSIWSNLYGAPASVSDSRYTDLSFSLASPIAPWGWAADGDRSDVKFTDQSSQITQIVRGRILYQYGPQLQLSGSFGYEDNKYPFSDYHDVVYGIQALYRPSERTSLLAGWEHRFFGASYVFTFDHRMPLSVIHVNVFRNTTSYTQQLAALPAGANVSNLLNDILTTRIPDPTQRQTAVNQLIANQGLPQTLSGPVNLYTQQIILQQSALVTLGLLGASNSVFLSGYYLKQEPISGSGNPLPPAFSFGNDNTQTGVFLTWSHPMSSATTLAAEARATRTTANSGIPFKTDAYYVRGGVNWTASAYTSFQFGARYQRQRGDFVNEYNEFAVFAGVNYVFH